MNWGKGIVIGMAAFMGFILTMVVIMMRQDIDLVTENYYQEELNFNEQIEAQQNYLNSGKEIQINVVEGTLELAFPEGFQNSEVTLQLKRPNDERLDFTINFTSGSLTKVPLTQLKKGLYYCSLEGQYNGKAYQLNKEITL